MAKPLRILVAEDEETDAFFLKHALQKAGLSHELVVACDGQEAVDYLSGKGPYADRAQHPLPALLLFDLKMPRMTGFEVLAWLQNQADLKSLPAIVLTSSANDNDRQRAQQLGAADFRVKPSSILELVHIVQDLHAKWLEGKGSPDL